MRGEDQHPPPLFCQHTGSPPRAWGRQPANHADGVSARFTPTCVGKTRPRLRARRRSPVHPHVRGEDHSPVALDGLRHGSPPRAWGRRASRWVAVEQRRFTPTCVGKTLATRHRSLGWSVHPHVRGEDALLAGGGFVRSGSPPRAWGRRNITVPTLQKERFTPTCVGKTPAQPPASAAAPVHPHVRGEDWCIWLSRNPRGGSPPRAWGRRLITLWAGDRCRFTPTCVGKTVFPSSANCSPAVHPHVRGEDCWAERWQFGRCGSPPRAWGRREPLAAAPLGDRFTPTCVGKTRGWS